MTYSESALILINIYFIGWDIAYYNHNIITLILNTINILYNSRLSKHYKLIKQLGP